MSSTYGQENLGFTADLKAGLQRLIFNQDHTATLPMVLASAAVASVLGFGMMAAAQSNAPVAALVGQNTPALDADLVAALNAAVFSVDAATNVAEAEPSVPVQNRVAMAQEAAVQDLPAAPVFPQIDIEAVDTAGLTGHDPARGDERPAITSYAAALLPASLNLNRLAGPQAELDEFEEPLPVFEEAVVAINSGDTMMDLLTGVGIDRREAYYAIEAFGDVFDPRRIRAGQEFSVAYEVLPPLEQGSADDNLRLTSLSMRTAPDREVNVRWDAEADDYVGEARDIALVDRYTRGRGEIDSSLYLAANEIGVPDAVTIELIRIFSHSVDFQRDIRDGDSFDVYYSRRYDEDGVPVMMGDVEFASLVTRGREQRLYRFTTPDDGDTDYYDADGKSVRAFLMRTPIDGARITSSFGPRRHPVLGYNRMHKGVDFGAPTGTPIYAAGNGTVVRASRYGAYGNYVRVRHANGYETAYAHLNGYGPGIRSGVRVEQGQVIGYVGATGRVTGAHLHYEVLYNDEQVNPRTIDLPSGRQLEGDVLEAFELERVRIESQMALAPTLEVTATASAGSGNTPNPDLSPE